MKMEASNNANKCVTLAQAQIFAQSLSSIVEIILANINFNLQYLMEKRAKWMTSPEVFYSNNQSARILRIVDINVEAVKDQKILVCHKCAAKYKLADGSTKAVYLETCCAGCGNSHEKINRCKKMKNGVCDTCKCKAKHHVECAFKTTKEETEMYDYYSEFEEATKIVDEYIDDLVYEKNELINGIRLLIDFLMVNSAEKIAERLHYLAIGQKIKFDKFKVRWAVNAGEIQESMEKLKSLKIYGAKIASVYQADNLKSRGEREIVVQSKNSAS